MQGEIIVAILTSAALIGFVQFLIVRHDNQSSDFKKLTDEINNLRDQIVELHAAIKLKDTEDARRRILDASDAVRNYDHKHSKEWWDQVNTDIDEYHHYCENHHEYENNRAVMAIANLERIYQTSLAQNDFL